MQNKNNTKAYLVSIIAGVISAIVLFFLWVVVGVSFYLSDGGDFGGLGAAAQPGDGPLQKGPALTLVTLLLCGIQVFVMVGVFKLMSRNTTKNSKNQNSSKPNSSFRIVIISLLVPIIIILGLKAYSYYKDNRTGSLNPYTEICKEHGSIGAKGDYCIDK